MWFRGSVHKTESVCAYPALLGFVTTYSPVIVLAGDFGIAFFACHGACVENRFASAYDVPRSFRVASQHIRNRVFADLSFGDHFNAATA